MTTPAILAAVWKELRLNWTFPAVFLAAAVVVLLLATGLTSGATSRALFSVWLVSSLILVGRDQAMRQRQRAGWRRTYRDPRPQGAQRWASIGLALLGTVSLFPALSSAYYAAWGPAIAFGLLAFGGIAGWFVVYHWPWVASHANRR